MTRRCLTHPGEAHVDDFLSVCVEAAIAADAGLELVVERREPTDAELNDPAVVVVDTGMQYDPGRNNYDHHQLPREAEAECALSLLARHRSWDGESVFEAFGATRWFPTLRVMDSKGPYALAGELGTTNKVVFRLLSPVDRALLAEFQAETLPVSLLASVGKRLLDQSVAALRAVNSLSDRCLMVEAGGVSGYVLEDDDTTGTDEWRELRAPGTAFSIVYDNRGPGWALFRYDDDPRINFSRLAGREEVIFAHNGGFIAKTASREEITLERALELVRDAVVRP